PAGRVRRVLREAHHAVVGALGVVDDDVADPLVRRTVGLVVVAVVAVPDLLVRRGDPLAGDAARALGVALLHRTQIQPAQPGPVGTHLVRRQPDGVPVVGRPLLALGEDRVRLVGEVGRRALVGRAAVAGDRAVP